MERRGFLRALVGGAAAAPFTLTKEQEKKVKMKPTHDTGCVYCGIINKDLLIIPVRISATIVAAKRIICPRCFEKLIDQINE